MKTVKEVCPHCEKAIKFGKKELFARALQSIVGNLLMVLGLVFIIYLSVVGWEQPIDDIINLEFQSYSSEVDLEIRTLTIEATEGCKYPDSFCYARKVFDNISSIRYVPSSMNSIGEKGVYDPMYIYNYGGDCKNSAYLFVSMLKSVGIYAYVDCSIGDAHCISVVPHIRAGEKQETKMVVDLTSPIYIEMFNNESTWDYSKQENINRGAWNKWLN